jgi:toxin ParE1/3/4
MPAPEVLFHRLAAREYGAARDWYGARSPEVAQRFHLAVDRAVSRIATNAERLPVLVRQFRWVRVGRFPYVLIFRATSHDVLIVVAVAHTSRRPGYWRRRT